MLLSTGIHALGGPADSARLIFLRRGL